MKGSPKSINVHLNAVRVGRLEPGKAEPQRARAVGYAEPGAELVRRRLAELERYPWSSWRVYSGKGPPPRWRETGNISDINA